MSRWTSLALSLAMVAASTPAAAADPMGVVVDKVQRAQELRQFAAAAELAAPARLNGQPLAEGGQRAGQSVAVGGGIRCRTHLQQSSGRAVGPVPGSES